MRINTGRYNERGRYVGPVRDVIKRIENTRVDIEEIKEELARLEERDKENSIACKFLKKELARLELELERLGSLSVYQKERIEKNKEEWFLSF